MDFKSLHYPLTVAEHKSISLAAEKLNIKQPSLSKYLKTLEDSIGTPIFEMRGQELVITYAGERYLNWAKKILPLIYNLNKLSLLEKEAVLKVVCPIHQSTFINPFALHYFWEKYPNIYVELKESVNPEEVLMSGEVDLAILNHKPERSGFSANLLAANEIILVTSLAHPIRRYAAWNEDCRYQVVDIALLRNENYIELRLEHTLKQIIETFLKEQNINLNPVMQTDSIEQAVRTAAAAGAVCFIPEQLIRQYTFPEKVAKYSLGTSFKMELYLAYNQTIGEKEYTVYLSKLLRSFLD
ncbi:MAG: LysR family transcriptional regulator [Lachnospiraceae bacterium]